MYVQYLNAVLQFHWLLIINQVMLRQFLTAVLHATKGCLAQDVTLRTQRGDGATGAEGREQRM